MRLLYARVALWSAFVIVIAGIVTIMAVLPEYVSSRHFEQLQHSIRPLAAAQRTYEETLQESRQRSNQILEQSRELRDLDRLAQLVRELEREVLTNRYQVDENLRRIQSLESQQINLRLTGLESELKTIKDFGRIVFVAAVGYLIQFAGGVFFRVRDLLARSPK